MYGYYGLRVSIRASHNFYLYLIFSDLGVGSQSFKKGFSICYHIGTRTNGFGTSTYFIRCMAAL